MNKLLLALVMSPVICFSHFIQAEQQNSESDLYAKGMIGYSSNRVSAHDYTDPHRSEYSNHFNSKNTWKFSGTAALGYNFMPSFNIPFRVELDYTAREKYSYLMTGTGYRTNVTHNKVRVNNLLFNTYFDLHTDWFVTPYAFFGLGTAFAKYNVNNNNDTNLFNSNKTNFAWSLGAGVALDITPELKADFLTRYVNNGKVNTNYIYYDNKNIPGQASSKVKLNAIDIMLGLRYSF